MNKIIGLVAAITLVVAGEYHQDRLLVYLENDVSAPQIRHTAAGVSTGLAGLDVLLARYQAREIRPWLPSARPDDRDGDIFLNRFYEILFTGDRSDLNLLQANFQKDSAIRLAEFMPVHRPDYTPNDPRYNQQWFLPNIQAPEAWDLWDIDGGELPGSDSTREIRVGIVDSGVDWDHPDLIGNIWQNLGEDADGDGLTLLQSGGTWIFDPDDLNGVDDDGSGKIDDLIGWDLTAGTNGEDNDPGPNSSGSARDHGTLVAGTVSGMTNNALGIASVGWSVRLIPVKCSYEGSGYINRGYDGLLYAGQIGADVINLSWGGYGSSTGEQSVVNVVHNQYGAIIVASAGNGNEDTGYTNLDTHYPSGYDNVISVTATGSGDNFTCWATAGPTVDLCAPGENIMTTNLNGGYTSVWGTSFSSPITAGATALLWSKFPAQTQSWIENRIVTATDYFADMDGTCSVTNVGETTPHSESMVGMLGSGRLNIYKALIGGVLPSLVVQDVNVQNDTDGDGEFNPGETANLKIILFNEEGWATATNVVARLRTADPRITILDSIITFSSDIDPGNSAFTLFDSFQISALSEALTGNVPMTVVLSAGSDPYLYTDSEEITVRLSLNQSNFPFVFNANVNSSPTAVDLDLDGELELYFGSNNFNLYGLDPLGGLLTNFPVVTGNQVQSSIAVADLNGDGSLELVFGSKDKKIYILNSDGTVQRTYLTDGYVLATPALADLDGDGDFEIVAGTFETGNQGKLYAFHHDGTDVSGFPVNIAEPVMVACAIGDIDHNGELDIVLGTWSNRVWAVSAAGQILAGFPFTAGGRINVAPSLADVTSDQTLEIAVGSDDGNLYLLNPDGSVFRTLTTGSMLRAGPVFQDLNGDHLPEVIFGGYDQKLHAYDVSADAELTGWPVLTGANIVSAPCAADLDNDGTLEIVSATSDGTLIACYLDGSAFANFPLGVGGSINSPVSIADLDSDGDYEIMAGTSVAVEIIDIKSPAGNLPSWKIFRGNLRRTGAYADALMEIDEFPDSNRLPTRFRVSGNYPNPFNPETQVRIEIPSATHLDVRIYDLLGRQVKTLVAQEVPAGIRHVRWSGTDASGAAMPTGIYLLQIVTEQDRSRQKLLLLK